MDILTAIHERRSIRRYSGEPVSEEHREILLRAAMAAPSAGNSRPWRFVVVDDKALLTEVSTLSPYIKMAKNAPLGILVCADTTAEKHAGFWVQDCSAAVQNILLAATGIDLGAVWTGIHPVEDRVAAFKALFGLPEHVMPLGFIVIGHPEQAPPATIPRAKRFDSSAIHHNRW